MDIEEEFARHRAELVTHCYRLLGSLHDAEDALQEAYLRAWRGQAGFEERSSVRTWLYRIATNVCLNQLQHSSRRVVPSALGQAGSDPDELQPPALEVSWLEPLPDLMLGTDPATVVGDRQSLRLAVVAAMQHLAPRQRAVLILREVLTWPAAEVAATLGTTTAAVNSSLQRARAELARIRPAEEDLSEPDDPARRALLDRFSAAMESKDLGALEGLFTADARWEMPPIPDWFSGRDAVLGLLDSKLQSGPGRRVLVETAANGQPAFALYIRGADASYHAHSIKVLTLWTPARTASTRSVSEISTGSAISSPRHPAR